MRIEGMDVVDEVVVVAGLLACPTRLAAYRLVGEEGLGVTEVAALLGIAPSTASYHLAALAAGGLLGVRARGRRRTYRWAKRRWFVSTVAPR